MKLESNLRVESHPGIHANLALEFLPALLALFEVFVPILNLVVTSTFLVVRALCPVEATTCLMLCKILVF